MDTGKGKFVDLTPKEGEDVGALMQLLEEKYPNHGGWFQEGEVLVIKGSTFRVKRIKPTEITLKLVKRG